MVRLRNMVLAASLALLSASPAPVWAEDAADKQGYVATTDGAVTDTYPHITTLEKAILGHTYLGQPLADRLGRMEQKAFGKASTSADLSDRTDALEDYSQKSLHQRSASAGSAAETDGYETSVPGDTRQYSRSAGGSAGGASAASNSGAGGAGDATASADGGLQSLPTEYPHITALEKEILGQAYPGTALPERLNRMETKAFGQPSTADDYSERTDALEAYAQKKLHAKPFVHEQKQDAVALGGGPEKSSGGGTSKLLNIVENGLLSMAGVGRMGMPMMMGNPAVGNGLGGGLIPGFSGVRMRPKTAVDNQDASAPAENRSEDPAVHAQQAPPAEAKMLTRVGWCEVQTFGHTFPNLHLPARLQQLAKELNYAPGKSSLELMDDMNGLVGAVQKHNRELAKANGTSQAISPTSAAVPH